LSNSTIGIKVADGSYYPVLEQGFRGRKKLILTTVHDNQSKVQIDLYRGNGSSISKAQYLGSLLIEGITPAAQGEPEIALVIGLDRDDQLSAEASDSRTGERQNFSTTLATLTESQTYDEPEFALEEAAEKAVSRSKGTSTFLLVLFIVLGLILLGCIGFFLYKAVQGPKISTTVLVQPTPAAAAPAAAAPAATAPASTETKAVTPAASPETESTTTAKKVTYKVKKGDTLWDISAAYYRNPWLYPKIAKANNIKNPDLIFVGARIVIPEN
jgi:nucleoid-associated protein YgaU